MSRIASRLGSVELRIFLVCWVIFSVHFATNVVREHYPAFSLIERGDFILDEYVGFHSDIFVHTDGHAYIGNQVTGALIAAIPLLIFDPVLDALERPPTEASGGDPDAVYDTEYPNRANFFRLVKQRGLELRFGASTAVTSVFLMAPLSALFAVFIYFILRRRDVGRRRAVALTFLFAFGTPLFYRTAYLNHNVFLMMTIFLAFWLLWPRPEDAIPIAPWRVTTAGFLAGFGIALDYAGVVPLLWLYGYLLVVRFPSAGLRRTFMESLRFVAGSVPPVIFLCWTQWLTFGNPFMPGQYHMPMVNYTDRGWRGMDLPSPEILWRNLFDLDWGMYAFGPLLLLALLPARIYSGQQLILPRRERRAVATFIVAFMLFNAINQYSLMQWNTGFRYLLPLVPFIFLALSDHLARMPRWALVVVAVPVLLHTWVLSMVRYTRVDFGTGNSAVIGSWERFLEGGIRLPWLTVLRQTTPDPSSIVHALFLPHVIFALTAAICGTIWWLGSRAEAAAAAGVSPSASREGPLR